MRFSQPDNYWCFAFERAVKRYVTTKCNFKNIECSYAKREARRELLKHLAKYIKGQNTDRPYKIDLEKVYIDDFQFIISISLISVSLNTKVYYMRDFIWVPQL